MEACGAHPAGIYGLWCAEHGEGLSGCARQQSVYRGPDGAVYHGSYKKGSDNQHGAV